MTAPFCPACRAPAPVDGNGRIDKHPEQVVTAHGWGDGYTACAGQGRPPQGVQADALPPAETEDRELLLLGNCARNRVKRCSRGRLTIFNGKSAWEANPRILNRLLDQGLIWMDDDRRYHPTTAGYARLDNTEETL